MFCASIPCALNSSLQCPSHTGPPFIPSTRCRASSILCATTGILFLIFSALSCASLSFLAALSISSCSFLAIAAARLASHFCSSMAKTSLAISCANSLVACDTPFLCISENRLSHTNVNSAPFWGMYHAKRYLHVGQTGLYLNPSKREHTP